MQKACVCVCARACVHATHVHVYLKAVAALQRKWVTYNEVQYAFAL